ncbi:hypothetical protein GVAV_002592 [Gurleya vavrai]
MDLARLLFIVCTALIVIVIISIGFFSFSYNAKNEKKDLKYNKFRTKNNTIKNRKIYKPQNLHLRNNLVNRTDSTHYSKRKGRSKKLNRKTKKRNRNVIDRKEMHKNTSNALNSFFKETNNEKNRRFDNLKKTFKLEFFKNKNRLCNKFKDEEKSKKELNNQKMSLNDYKKWLNEVCKCFDGYAFDLACENIQKRYRREFNNIKCEKNYNFIDYKKCINEKEIDTKNVLQNFERIDVIGILH